MIRSIKTIQSDKKHRFKFKVLSVISILIIALSAVNIPVYAANNSWGLNTSQIDMGYFYKGGSSFPSGKVTSIQNAWNAAYSLASTFNYRVVDTYISGNMIKQMEFLYQNGYSDEAVAFGNRWNTIKFEIESLIVDTESICARNSRNEGQNLYNQLMDKQSKLQTLISDITSSYAIATTNTEYPDVANDISIAGVNGINTMWNWLGNTIKTLGTGSSSADSFFGISWTSSDIENVANSVAGVVKTFAYAIACILFGINVTSTALQYELLTLRGGVKVFVRVIFAKIWIDLAIPICLYILNLVNFLALQIFNLFTTDSFVVMWDNGFVSFEADTGTWLLDTIIKAAEKIINFFTNIIYSAPMLAMIIVLFVVIVSVFIKIVSRAFELTALVSVSPIFFATLVGEETKRYFRKFMSAFLSTAAYIAFVAIVYAVASEWIQSCTAPATSVGELLMGIINLLPRTIIIIACCRIMKKPPKVLTSLFEGV